MNHDRYDDAHIRAILSQVRTIAIVGASANAARPSYLVMKYLSERGYRVFPVNPGQAGKTVAGLTFVATLADVPEPIDMVDVFRAPEHVPAVVDEVLKLAPLPKVLWTQLGVRNDEAAARAEAAGLQVVMNRCPKIEYGRLSGEIGWTGVNSRTISSRKPLRLGQGVQRLSIAPRGPNNT
ncbi:CoA-binding protein [Xanthobacter autotrophicus]|uniref:CoA-binding protein n=1 Tax=Xanthobacter TaxID=279 RepID=UPI0024AA1E00|nr:CoA-binding protein [Xanthobacter autotrophicus]MDI4662735.1 CoA-binding protein [Xanthobacter autotrophicus]